MIVEALMAAESVYHFLDSIRDPAKYLYMTDSILEDIERRDDPVRIRDNTSLDYTR